MVGVALLLVEIFLIPGFGIVGVLGVLLMFWALLNAMVDRYPGGPWLPTFSQFQFPLLKLTGSLVVTFFAALFLGRYLPATPLFRRLVLEKAASAETGFQAGRNDASLIGLTGQALSFLRPAGTARFGERKLDVVTQGEYIPAGRTVRIVETHGSRIIVEPVESPEARS
jgi:membrane-bound serine protease (ClpP class)